MHVRQAETSGKKGKVPVIQLPIQITTGRLNRERLNMYYPIIQGMRNISIQQNMNNTIINTMNRLIRERSFYENESIQITGFYEVKTNHRGVVCLNLILYTHGERSQGMTILQSLTFDTSTGTLIGLPDLFKSEIDYVKPLSEIIRKQIEQRSISTIKSFEQIEQEHAFYIADKCLVLYAQLNDLTPVQHGFPYFPISVYDIQSIVKEDGPLGRMVG
ncbi:RsiV family protein [Marinicrinis sediminis]|uniref:RsiV family protein n=1 Tax=Marinicrinis sediminis TaxID=1652465 RepID=A0ABW5RF16_9BACL